MSDKPGKNPDTWLEDESAVSRAYRELKKATPPAHLDSLILAEARRATASQDNTVIRVQRWRKWTMPAALAATVVFAVPLVIRVFDNTPGINNNRGTTVTTIQKAADAGLATTGSAVVAESISATPAEVEVSRTPADVPRLEETSELSLDHLKQFDESDTLGNMAYTDRAARTERKADSTSRSDSVALLASKPSSPIATTSAPQQPAVAVEADRSDQGSARPPAAFRDQAPAGDDQRLSQDTTVNVLTATPPKRDVSEPAFLERHRRDTESAAMQETFAAETTRMAASGNEQETGIEEIVVTTGSRMEPEVWLTDIAEQHRDGRILTARLGLGEFLTEYPDYQLPDDFPLQAGDALFDNDETGKIVPEAESWLRGIGMMAERGQIDQARTQLAKFFKTFPDYELPANFPLTRDDALPIER